jgi:hypothetical protein
MEPNDEQLVVAFPGQKRPADEAFMPFEDTLLGHVLARAFLLADDAKIRDENLRRQIART